MPDTTSASPAKIPLINGLRGLAILGVVFHHLWGQVFAHGKHLIWYGHFPLSPLTFLSNSYQGVTLFFILSGFVLALPYAQNRRTMSSRADIWSFYRRRAARLLPLYFLAVIIGLIFVAPVDAFVPFLKQCFFLFTGTFTFTEKYFFPEINFVLWSLSLELLFSLMFPLMVYLMQKYGVWRVVFFACVFALLARFFGIFLLAEHIAKPFTGTTTPVFNTIFCRIDDFILGMGLAVLYVHKPTIRAAWFYITGFASLLLGFFIRDLSESVLPLVVQPVSNTFINIGFTLLLAVMLLRPHQLWKMTIENKVLQLIGLMSYSLFIWHGIAIAPLNGNDDAVHLIRYVILVFALSFLTYRYIETSTPQPWRTVLPKKLPEME